VGEPEAGASTAVLAHQLASGRPIVIPFGLDIHSYCIELVDIYKTIHNLLLENV